ncbi:MAG: DUF4258 domain-containing protein [Deltaproteobacteria bacterium]
MVVISECIFHEGRIRLTKGEILISGHGYDELAADNLFVRKLVSGLNDAELLEDYPDFPKGPCVLVLQKDDNDQPIHVVWGIPKGTTSPAVLITAYRADSELWTDDFRRRKK